MTFTYSYTQASYLNYIVTGPLRHTCILHTVLDVLEHSLPLLRHTVTCWVTDTLLTQLPHPPPRPSPPSEFLPTTNLIGFLPTYFPPFSGASGASLQSLGGRGQGRVSPADVARQLTCNLGHTLHWARFKGTAPLIAHVAWSVACICWK